MKIISRPVGGGKTTELVQMMAEDENSVYVGPTRSMTLFAYELSQRLGLNIEKHRFVPLANITSHGGLRGFPAETTLVVDEMESILSYILGGYPIRAMAITEKSDSSLF